MEPPATNKVTPVIFSRMRSKGSCFPRGVWELRLCSLLSFSKVSRQVVMSFCAAGAALWRPPSSFRVAGASLQTCRGACSTLHTPPSTLHTPHFTLYTPHFTLHTLHSAISPYTLHSTLYTPHCTLRTPHSTLYTLHSTLTSPESL